VDFSLLALDRPRSSGRLPPAPLRTAARLVVLVIGSRAPALLSVSALRSPAEPVGPVGVPARLRACSQARPRERESAGRSGRRTCPSTFAGGWSRRHAHMAPKFARSRAGSPTRATRHQAIFSTATPPYPKGGA